MSKTYDAIERKLKIRSELRCKRLSRRIDRLRDDLSCRIPRDRKRFKPLSGLRGAAKPACEVYSEYYPEIDERREEEERREDLLSQFSHKLASHKETFEFAFLHIVLATKQIDIMKFKEAELTLKSLLKDYDRTSKRLLDFTLPRLVSVFFNDGDLDKVAKLLKLGKKNKCKNIFLLWDEFIMNYISWNTLKEETEDAVLKSIHSATASIEGKQILQALVNHIKFEENLIKNHKVEEIGDKEVSVLEAHSATLQNAPNFHTDILYESEVPYEISIDVRYFHRSISWYRDVGGIFEYLSKFKSAK